jgi:pimeloyl-ACP methyl ester carboxylesterase
VLLHRTGGPKEHWLPAWVPVLVGGGRHVGGSEVAPPPYSIVQLAGDAAGAIEHLGLEPCAVVGYSMGASWPKNWP